MTDIHCYNIVYSSLRIKKVCIGVKEKPYIDVCPYIEDCWEECTVGYIIGPRRGGSLISVKKIGSLWALRFQQHRFVETVSKEFFIDVILLVVLWP